ncbi:MAG: SSI family serine proteinase inhibitor [Gaiellaceae bacterium]
MFAARILKVAIALAILITAWTPEPLAAEDVQIATDLRITVWPDGRYRSTPPVRYTLRCFPPAGRHPRPQRACAALSRMTDPFAPDPPGTGCFAMYLSTRGAPVVGFHAGRKVWVSLHLGNGCGIERWRKLKVVVPGYPAKD